MITSKTLLGLAKVATESKTLATAAKTVAAEAKVVASSAKVALGPGLAGLKNLLVETPSTSLGPMPFAKNIAGVPVKSATRVQYQGLVGGRPEMTEAIDVGFGKLTQAQFKTLQAEFGGVSQRSYSAQDTYTARDFMSPAVQALVGQDVDAGAPVVIANTKRLAKELSLYATSDVSISASPNCHGTAWEIARHYRTPGLKTLDLAYGDAQLVELNYPAKFKQVVKPTEKLAVDALKPGDVVTFRSSKDGEEGPLLHSTTYVGGGLFFEKPDTESDAFGETAYRLVTLEQSMAPAKNFLGDAEKLFLAAWRPKAALAPTPKVFAMEDELTRKLEGTLNKQRKTVDKALTAEYEVGLAGSTRGVWFNAVLSRVLQVDARGLGTSTPAP